MLCIWRHTGLHPSVLANCMCSEDLAMAELEIPLTSRPRLGASNLLSAEVGPGSESWTFRGSHMLLLEAQGGTS